MPKHKRRLVTFCAAALFPAFLVSGCSLQPDVSTRVLPTTHTSQPAPALRGATLSGSHIDLTALRGHPVVIDFWASWCGPCRAQQPELNSLVSKYAARGVEFLGVDIRDDTANASAYVHEFNITYPSVFDPASDDAGDFSVAAPPTTLVIDRSGNIMLRELGTLVDIPAALDSLLGSH